MSSSQPPLSDCEIDPTVLADVTRVVQELMRLQQEQELEEREQLKAKHHHNHDPLDGISTISREFHDPDALEHADRQDVQETLLPLHDSQQEQREEEEEEQRQEQHELLGTMEQVVEDDDMPTSPILLLSSSSSVSSLSSYNTAPILANASASPSMASLPLPVYSSTSASSPPQQVPTGAFQLEGSAISHQDLDCILLSKSQPLSLSQPEINGAPTLDQTYNSLLPGQKTPTRSTTSSKGPTTNREEDDHQYFSHPPPATQKNNDTKKTWVPSIAQAEPTLSLTNTEVKTSKGSYPGLSSDSDIENIIQEIKDATFTIASSGDANAVSSAEADSALIVPRPVPAAPTRPRRKKALLIGINYFGDPNQLLGCINDSRDVFGFLNGYYGFRYQDTVILTDDQIYEDKRPTGANIRYWMKWLVKDAEPQDSLFFHYAGKQQRKASSDFSALGTGGTWYATESQVNFVPFLH